VDKKTMRWNAIARRFDKSKDIVGVEVGVWKGSCSERLLSLLPKLTLYMVDRWTVYTKDERDRDKVSQMCKSKQASFDSAYMMARQKVKKYGKRAVILKTDSIDASDMFGQASVDFVFLDGDHSYEGLIADIDAWLPKIKPGGWLCGHDYTEKGKRPGITKAVKERFGKSFSTDSNQTWFYRVS